MFVNRFNDTFLYIFCTHCTYMYQPWLWKLRYGYENADMVLSYKHCVYKQPFELTLDIFFLNYEQLFQYNFNIMNMLIYWIQLIK